MKRQRRYRKSTILLVLEILCGLLFVVALILLIQDIQVKNNTFKNTGSDIAPPVQTAEAVNVPGLDIDKNATEKKETEPIKSERNVSIPGFKTLRFASGTDVVSVDLYNPEKNAGLYYLTFELKIPDGSGSYETLYESGYVEGGKHLYEITLNHAMDEGVYEHCILHVQPYTVDDRTPTNNADIEFTLRVE